MSLVKCKVCGREYFKSSMEYPDICSKACMRKKK